MHMRRVISTKPVKTDNVMARVTIAERQKFEAAAQKEGVPLSAWVRAALAEIADQRLAA